MGAVLNDDESIREELARHLVEALVNFRAEACDANGAVRDHESMERLASITELLQEDRRRVLLHAEAEHGAAFAAWVTELLGRFDATEPPISLERQQRTPKE